MKGQNMFGRRSRRNENTPPITVETERVYKFGDYPDRNGQVNTFYPRDGSVLRVGIVRRLIEHVGAEAVTTCPEVTDKQRWKGTSAVSLDNFVPVVPPVLIMNERSRVAPQLSPDQIALARNAHMKEFCAGNCPGGPAQVEKCYPESGPDRRDLVQTLTGLVKSKRISSRLPTARRKARQELLVQLADDSL